MNEVYRPGFGRGLTVVVGVIGVLSIVLVAARDGLEMTALTIPWVALFVTACWAIFWRPCVEVSDAGVRLVNVARTIMVPWPAMVDVETRYALTLHTSYGTYRAWAAPAPGAGPALRTAARTASTRGDGDDENQGVTIGELSGTASGDAAIMVRRRWERLRDDGHLDDPRLEFEVAPIRWHWAIGGSIVVLAALSIATLFRGG